MNSKSYWKEEWSNRPIEKHSLFSEQAYKLIKKTGLKTLLDLGCGNGRDSIYFAKKGLKVTSVDISESGIAKLKSTKNNINCIVSNIKDIDFKNNSFDVVFAHLSLHYFNDQTTKKIFDKLYQILKKDGLIFIKCKSTEDPLFGKGEKVGENIYKEAHMRNFFTKEYMAEKLAKFKIIKIRKTSGVHYNNKSNFIDAIATK